MTPPAPESESILTDAPEPPPSALRILVANETGRPCDDRRIESAALAALSNSAYTQGTISVAVVDDATIHRINREFLDHDYPTDVLSFALENEPPRLDGEIVLSIDAAERGAVDAGWTTEAEMLLYIVHGALHLAGYDDHAPADVAEMRAREAEILDGLGTKRSARDSRWNGVSPAVDALEDQAT